MSKKLVRLTESDLHRIIKESVYNIISELSHNTYQNVSNQAFDNNDIRLSLFRKQAEKTYNDNRNYRPFNYIRDNSEDDNFIKLNNGKTLIIFDEEYKNLNDLYNGLKCGKLLIHCRGMVGEVDDSMRYIYPSFSETLLKYYADEYDDLYDSKKEYYGDDFNEDEYIKYPELIFASDNFAWADSERNGVFFIESDGFQKSLGDGKIQLPNGTICKYYEGDVYDYDSEIFQDEPICCEYGDWYSRSYAKVVAVLNIK